MHRSPYSRVLYIALTLWMSLFMSESEWVVRCPSHGGSHAAVTASGDAAAAHDHVAGHSAAPGGGHSTAPDSDDGHGCACPGPGCCPPAVAVMAACDVPLAHVVAVHEAIAASTLDVLAEASDYLQPPATAPPAAALAPVA